MIRKICSFIGRVFMTAIRTVKDWIVAMFSNIEAVLILSLATIGTAALLTEIPFYVAIPIWIESMMVIPVLSAMIVLTIVVIMERRLSLCGSGG